MNHHKEEDDKFLFKWKMQQGGINMNHQDGKFLYHTSCEACGSSDAKSVYSTGSAYCFSCRTWFPPEDGGEVKTTKRRRVKGLKTDITFKALNKRKIKKETCKKFDYGYSTDKGEVVQVATYHDANGNRVAQHLRTKDKQFRWQGETGKIQLFGQHLWQTGKRLVITEGEIDAMTIAQVFNLRWAVVSVPNGAPSAKKYIKQNLEFIEGFDEVVFAFDNDQQGRDAIAECAPLVKTGKARVATFAPYKDASDMMQSGKMAEIAPAIFNAKIYRPDGIIAGSDITLEYLMSEEDAEGYEIQYPKLNKMLKTLRKGELTTLTAGTGAGKTTIARELAFHLLKQHNLKIGYVALEEGVKKSALGFMAIDLGVPLGDLFLDKSIVEPEKFEKSHKEIISSDNLFFYDHFGSLESDNLMAKIKYLASGLDVDFIVLDHISIVVSGIEGGNERRTIDNLMTNLRSIVEHTGVGLLLISHLRVPQGQKSAHEEGGRVTLNQLRGSGSIKQLSDNIIAVERDQQAENPNISNLRVLKNRLFGLTGLVDVCRYNIVTGRLTALDEKELNEHRQEEEKNEAKNIFGENPEF